MTTETAERPIPSLLYDDEQDALRAVVRAIVEDLAPWTEVVKGLDQVRPFDDRLWRQLAQAGVAGLLIPEEFGGSGASAVEMAVVVEELGRAAAPVPALTSAVLATSTLTALPSSAFGGVLEAMAAGEVAVAPLIPASALPDNGWTPAFQLSADGRVTGQLSSVAGVLGCAKLLVPANAGERPVLVFVDASDAGLTTTPSLDMTRPISRVELDGAPAMVVSSGPEAYAALRGGIIAATALLASEQLGTAERALEVTCEHLRTRFQFGRALGSYQALRHGAAQLWTDLTGARAVARYAVACLAAGDPDTELAAHLAEAVCAEVALRTTESCLQMMGGIGFTWEHPTHLLLKRAAAGLRLLGTPEAHRLAIGRLRDIPPVHGQ
jgi:alkylation response protein AidB-like acyl-CoA dehydrogenase